MTIQITVEQITERDRWESMLIDESCTLADALMMTLQAGAPASPYLIARLEQAFSDYARGDFDDLAVPFGCAEMPREKQKMEHETHRSNVKFHVQSFIDQKYKVLNPNNYPGKESAFTKTADLLKLKNLTASTAFDIHYDRDIRKRKARK